MLLSRSSAALALLAAAAVMAGAADGAAARFVSKLDARGRDSLYPGNRAPLLPSPLVELPPGSIQPQGWLRQQLELMADGFTGHLEELSKFCRRQHNAWINPAGEGAAGWEEVPYWLKGYVDLG